MKGVKFAKVSVNNACAPRNSAREVLGCMNELRFFERVAARMFISGFLLFRRILSQWISLLLASEEENLNDNPKSRLCCPCLRHYEGQLAFEHISLARTCC